MNLIQRMLSKDPAKRPTVRQILELDFIRSKALLLRIELPKKRIGANKSSFARTVALDSGAKKANNTQRPHHEKYTKQKL